MLVGLSLALLGGSCGRFKTILIDEPVEGLLLDDPSPAVMAAARVGNNFDASTVEVRFNGVDLIQALGLTPPFSGASGVVMIGGEAIAVADFTYQTNTSPDRIDLSASGFALGAHTFEVEGSVTGGGALVSRSVGFEILAPLVVGLGAVPSAGLPQGPADLGSEGVLVNASLGQPIAAPPVGLTGGGELRSGFVPATEGLIAGGTP
jgi:hypothetical protein